MRTLLYTARKLLDEVFRKACLAALSRISPQSRHLQVREEAWLASTFLYGGERPVLPSGDLPVVTESGIAWSDNARTGGRESGSGRWCAPCPDTSPKYRRGSDLHSDLQNGHRKCQPR